MARISKDYLYLYYEHGINIETRTIECGTGKDEEMDVDGKLASNVIKGLHILTHTRAEEPINIIMNCQGGDTQHGLAIFDAIHMAKRRSPVHITVLGHCYSIAAWILQAGTVRRISQSSSLMIHDGDKTVSGREEQTRPWYLFYQEQDVYCRQILLQRIRERHPDFTLAKLEKMLKRDTILWPKQAVELGLADEVVRWED